jgi:uncharacterized membrane protein YhaH (DUF805 family)
MGFFDAIRICFAKYVDFTGRASRPEFWYFVLFVFIAELSLLVAYRPLGIAFVIAAILPRLAVAIRRLHDIDRSGWWIFIVVIPVVGWIMLLIWYCKKGDEHANRFGDPPLSAPPNMTARV